jgi:hypothetical protein
VATASAADPEMPAWRRIALRLTARHRTAAALRSSIAEWLFVIPVVGQIASAMLSTVDEISGRGSPTAAHGTGSCLDDVRRILAHGRSDPRLIVLTHCEAADAGELGGAFALIREIRSTRTLLVVSASDAAGDTRGFRDLVWEAERLGVGRLVAMEQPLTESQAELLRCAASLGSRFETARLVHLMGQSEDQIERRLAELVRSKVLALHGTIERDGDLTDVYEFVDVAVAARWRGDA